MSLLMFTLLVISSNVLHLAESAQESVSTSNSHGPTYNAAILLHAKDEDCEEDATVEGNGVKDTLKLPCKKDKHGRAVVNEENKIVIGGEPGDDHGILGAKPNTLVVFEDGKCVEKSYPPGGKPSETVLSDVDCDAAKKDMQDTKKKAKEKEEVKEREFENIGKDLELKTRDLDMNTHKIEMEHPFKSMSNDLHFDLIL